MASLAGYYYPGSEWWYGLSSMRADLAAFVLIFGGLLGAVTQLAKVVPSGRVAWYLPEVPVEWQSRAGVVQLPCRESGDGVELVAERQCIGLCSYLPFPVVAWFRAARRYRLSYPMACTVSVQPRCVHGISDAWVCAECQGTSAWAPLRRIGAAFGWGGTANYVECGPTNPQTAYRAMSQWGTEVCVWVACERYPYVDLQGVLRFTGDYPGVSTTILAALQETPGGVYYWSEPVRRVFRGVEFWVVSPRLATGCQGTERDYGAAGRRLCQNFVPPPTRLVTPKTGPDGKPRPPEVTYRYTYAVRYEGAPRLEHVVVSDALHVRLLRYLEAVQTATTAAVARQILTSAELQVDQLRGLAQLLIHSSVTERRRESVAHAYFSGRQRHRLYGDPVPVPVHAEWRCVSCGGYPPMKFRWRHGMCPVDHAVFQLSLVGVNVDPRRQSHASGRVELDCHNGPLGAPLGRLESPVYPKQKDVLDGFSMSKRDAEKQWKDLGWKGPGGVGGPLPERAPYFRPPRAKRASPEPKVACCDVGVVHWRTPSMFTATLDTVLHAVKSRLFLCPKAGPNPEAWERLGAASEMQPLGLHRGERVVPLQFATALELRAAITAGWFPSGLEGAFVDWEGERRGEEVGELAHVEGFVPPFVLGLACPSEAALWARLHPALFIDATGCDQLAWERLAPRAPGRVVLATSPFPEAWGVCPKATYEVGGGPGVYPSTTWEELCSVGRQFERATWISAFPPARAQALWQALGLYLSGAESTLPDADACKRDGWREEFGEFTVFVKRELAANGFPDPLVDGPDVANPRAIQAPHDVAHCIAGPYLRPATVRLHDYWHADNVVYYTSGSTPEQLDAWINRFADQRGQPKGHWVAHQFVQTDYSAYDCTHSTFSFRYVEQLYESWGICTPEVRRVLAAWRQPCGRTCLGGRYRAQVMNGSGRDDTSMVNVLLNGSAQYCAWARSLLGKEVVVATADEVAWLDANIRIAVMGDDALTVAPRTRYDGQPWREEEYAAALAEFGFETKISTTSNAWCAVYLGCRPYPVEGGLAWGPTLGRRLYKHHVMVWPSKQDPYAWLKGLCRAEAGLYSFVPFLAPIAERAMIVLKHHCETPYVPSDWKWVERRSERVRPADPEVVGEMLVKVYGITPAMYDHFLSLLQRVETLPYHLNCEAVDRCFLTDIDA